MNKKFIINWFVYALAIFITAYLLPGVHVGGVISVLVLAIVLGIINNFIKPVLIILTLPLSIVTLGLFSFIVNAFLILLTAWIVPGFSVNGFWWALAFSIILSIINSILGGAIKEKSSNLINN